MIRGPLPPAARRREAVLVALVIVGLALLAWSNRFIQDDAFISFRYADHLAHGKGLVWNDGERVEGYTNFLYTLIMSGPIAMGLDPIRSSFAVGLVAFLFCLVFTYGAARQVLRSRWYALLVIVLLGTNYTFSAYATGGMETQLQAALFAGSIFVLFKAMTRDTWSTSVLVALSLLLSAALLTRLDSAVLAAVVLAVALRGAMRGSLPRATRVARTLAILAPLLLIVGGWLACKLYYYGSILPNTYYVKTGALASIRRGLMYAWLFVSSYWLVLFLLLLLWYVARLPSAGNRPVIIPLTIVALWVLYTIRVGGDFMEFRFLVPVLPLWFIAVGWIIAQARSALLRSALALLVVSGSIHHARTFVGESSGIESVRDLSSHLREGGLDWIRIGRVLGDACDHDPDVTIAVTASGAIPFYSGLKTIDMVGLNDRWIARHGLYVGSRPGHQRISTFGYLVRRRANLVIAHAHVEDIGASLTVRRTSILAFVPMLSDDDRVPDDAQIVEIPVDARKKLYALYLVRHPCVDRAIQQRGWRAHRYALWTAAERHGRGPMPTYEPGTRVDFTRGESDPYVRYGWSGREFSIRWSTGREAAIVFAVERPAAGMLDLEIGRFLYSDARHEQHVIIALNDRAIATVALSVPDSRRYSIRVPASLVREENVLTFAMPGATVSTAEDDTPRRLGIRIESMRFSVAAETPRPWS